MNYYNKSKIIFITTFKIYFLKLKIIYFYAINLHILIIYLQFSFCVILNICLIFTYNKYIYITTISENFILEDSINLILNKNFFNILNSRLEYHFWNLFITKNFNNRGISLNYVLDIILFLTFYELFFVFLLPLF